MSVGKETMQGEQQVRDLPPIERQGAEYERILSDCKREIGKVIGDDSVETLDRWMFYARECDGLEIRYETDEVVIVEGERVSDLTSDVKRFYECWALDIALVMTGLYADLVQQEPEKSVFIILK